MYGEHEDLFYYITLYNENYVQPPMPEGVSEGIIRGIYKLRPGAGKAKVQLFGSGPMLPEALPADPRRSVQGARRRLERHQLQ
jgi:pyruvate dehydrogenase E1 component